MDGGCKEAEKLVLVMDQLNANTIGSLYETLPPEEARRIAKKLEIHYTPKHGSWLNTVEIGSSTPSKQCPDERMEDQQALRREVDAWQAPRNGKKLGVDWRLTTADARIGLKRLYPSVQE